MYRVAAALIACLCATGALAQTTPPLEDGRNFSLPKSFAGCPGEWSQSEAGSAIYMADCGGGDQGNLLIVSVIRPGTFTPEAFIQGMQKRLNRSEPLVERKVVLASGPETFLCWIGDTLAGKGMAVCALKGSSVRLSGMIEAPDKASAFKQFEQAMTQVAIR